MSATPFYLKGSGFPEGEPSPWIVSDFGLVDAIESGITKIPRLPVSDNTGQPDPKYFRLWRNITKDLVSGQRLSNGRPKPDLVWERAQDAFVQLAGEYKKTFDEIGRSSDTALKVPPVLIVVCDSADIAQAFFENISGQAEVEDISDEVEGVEEQAAPRKKRKTRVSYGTGQTYKGKPSRTPPDKPVNHVYALPERSGFEIQFPNVDGYVYALQRFAVKADFSEMERLVIQPEETPTATFVRIIPDHLEGGAHGGGIGEYVLHNRQEYYSRHHLQEIEFEIARQILSTLVGEGPQAPVKGSPRLRGVARHELFPSERSRAGQLLGADRCFLSRAAHGPRSFLRSE